MFYEQVPWAFRLDSIPEVVQSVEVGILTDSELSVIPKFSIIGPRWSHNTVSITLPTEGRVLNFHVASSVFSFHTLLCSLVSGIQKWIHDSSLHTCKTFPSAWNSIRNCKAHASVLLSKLLQPPSGAQFRHLQMMICIMYIPCCYRYLQI